MEIKIATEEEKKKAIEIAKTVYGVKSVDVFIKGVGLGRDAATRSLSSFDIMISSINDVTGIPHGGVRPPRARNQ